ncbi:D-tyrosyl-tRNA(Tyr) deacylase [Robertkochia marina]|uniref:D-aminoacyl-tRNA deacylase n=1 Tax=Robertkochia marina TaxID=1227945 RepID=A0A4S3M2K3_9FLAO|nr:D-aminoacyl-tRNA deacylase [Robertkochia marina]THD68905.1 D-tyrosyl-tRNA(Tyr) deacylase [Robertkochia marina]TRZ41150.1 D-tyrosyl-tRNA(Tyr) deacylase [Robertkochia marina]
MRALIQRVNNASVIADGKPSADIGQGLLVLLGVEENDTIDDVLWLSRKVCGLRIFNDGDGVMNLSVRDVDGELIVVSQFTLHASTKKGNRPSYIRAAGHEIAVPLYEEFVATLEKETGKKVGTGVFGAHMEISLVNDGPVTIMIDSKSRE